MTQGEAYQPKEKFVGRAAWEGGANPQHCEGEEEVMAKQSGRGSGSRGSLKAQISACF
jgi:hypothetical protein